MSKKLEYNHLTLLMEFAAAMDIGKWSKIPIISITMNKYPSIQDYRRADIEIVANGVKKIKIGDSLEVLGMKFYDTKGRLLLADLYSDQPLNPVVDNPYNRPVVSPFHDVKTLNVQNTDNEMKKFVIEHKRETLVFADDTPLDSKGCECGAHKVGSNHHSDWCRLFKADQ